MRSAARVVAILVTVLILTSEANAQSPNAANDSTATARDLLRTPDAEGLQSLQRKLTNLGDAAVKPLTEAISNPKASFIRLAFLIDTLARIKSTSAEIALAACLRDSRPFVRAHAARALARNNVSCAVPSIIRLINDSSAYAQEVSTDPYSEKTLTVSSAALTSLTNLTGLKLTPGGETPNAAQFQRYWEEHKVLFNCKGWN
jgi:HEAT repeat protein